MNDDQVSPAEIAELLSTLHGTASKLLSDQNGELYPVASSLTNDHKMPLLGAHTGEELPDPVELLDMLIGALRQQADQGEIRAAAVCANVSAGGSDALQYRVEGLGMDPFFTYYPYERAAGGGFEFAEPQTQSAPDRLIFP